MNSHRKCAICSETIQSFPKKVLTIELFSSSCHCTKMFSSFSGKPHQSTGFNACCSRYGDFSCASLFVNFPLFSPDPPASLALDEAIVLERKIYYYHFKKQ